MTRRAQRLTAHALFSLATAAVFARAVPYPLQRSWDDGRFILDNPDVRRVSWQALGSIFGAPHFQAYHPLHLLSYWLDVPWFGANALVLHAVNLLLWVGAANLLLAVYLALGCSLAAACLGAGLCAWHPSQVEVVSWATGRKDVLALLFVSASMLAHLRSSRDSDRHAFWARAAYLAALLSKTTALPLPAVLLFGDVWLRGRSWRSSLRAQIPNLVLAVLVGVWVAWLWNAEQMLRPGGAFFPRVTSTFGHQLGTALFPGSVAPMYSTAARTSASFSGLAACAALSLGLVAALRARAGRAAFALGSFVVWMLPVSNAVPMYFPYQDRYLSLPLLGLGFGAGAAFDALAPAGKRARPFMVAGALVLAALATRTAQYEGEWQSELRLWGHAASVQPDAFYAWTKLGEVRRDAGDLYGAIRAHQRALELEPLRKLAHVALFQAVALRDERLRGLSARTENFAKLYYQALGNASALRGLASELLAAGYLRALELPLAQALALEPVADAALEHAAALQFAEGRPSLGLFYFAHMRRGSQDPLLRAQAERARLQFIDAPRF